MHAIFESLLRALALDPVRDLMKRVDRTPIRSLLKRLNGTPQPDATWTINRMRRDTTSFRTDYRTAHVRRSVLGSNDKPLSRAPCVVESPTPRTSAEHDETRIIDQRSTTRDACRDPGGRRVS
jgi:hypothetical protein